MFSRTIILTVIFLFPISLMAQSIPSWVAKVGARTSPQHKTIFMVNAFGTTGHNSISETRLIEATHCSKKAGNIAE